MAANPASPDTAPPDRGETARALVACLCAEWCGVCRDYRARFDGAAAGFPQARFAWVDVEDEAALVDPFEVENFPTLLIATGGRCVFFGPITPQPETLDRLVRAALAGELRAVGDRALDALAARIGARP